MEAPRDRAHAALAHGRLRLRRPRRRRPHLRARTSDTAQERAGEPIYVRRHLVASLRRAARAQTRPSYAARLPPRTSAPSGGRTRRELAPAHRRNATAADRRIAERAKLACVRALRPARTLAARAMLYRFPSQRALRPRLVARRERMRPPISSTQAAPAAKRSISCRRSNSQSSASGAAPHTATRPSSNASFASVLSRPSPASH